MRLEVDVISFSLKCDIMIDVCSALIHCHKLRLVHRGKWRGLRLADGRG